MNTKRCAYCHKLSRAEAVTCSRCGQSFAEKTSSSPTRNSATSAGSKGNAVEEKAALRTRRRTIPPASPHRAGHYSGLHPEDQPYQSTMLAVQRPPESQAHPQVQKEPAIEYLPDALDPLPDDAALSSWSTAASRPTEVQTQIYGRPAPKAYMHPLNDRMKALVRQSGSPFWRGRYVPAVLTISCLIFLVASSLLAYVLINKNPAPNTQVLSAIPNQLRVNDTFILVGKGFGVNDLITFTHDQNNAAILDGSGKPLQAHANDIGAFSVQIMVPTNWEVGQHTVHAIDIGKDQTLSVVAIITVEQSSLAPPPGLAIAPVSLSYSGTTQQNPGDQVITLQNTSEQTLDWSSSVVTGDGAAWLSINPTSDHLAAHSSETITASVRSQQLAIGSYQGTINFKGGTNPSVTVALSVTAPGNVVASKPSLSFASAGQNPAAQTVTIQNRDGGPLGWWVTTYTVDGANWLNAAPASGHLEMNQVANAAISINVTTLKPQTYQGTVTFTYGVRGQTVQIPVSLSVSLPTAAQASVGTLTTNITIADSDAGSKVVKQRIKVNIVVKG